MSGLETRTPRRLARGTDEQVQTYAGPAGEVIVNLNTNRLHVQSGNKTGGHPLALLDDLKDTVPAKTVKGSLLGGAPTNLTKDQLLSLLDLNLLDLMPVGSVLLWPFATAPSGCLVIAGQLLSRSAYSRLWATVLANGSIVTEASWAEQNWGAFSYGDGNTTFRLPDPRGEFIRAHDGGKGIDTGRLLGSCQAQAVQKLTLNGGPPYSYLGGGGGAGSANVTTGGGSHNWSAINVLYVGSGTETRPRNIAWNYIIKY